MAKKEKKTNKPMEIKDLQNNLTGAARDIWRAGLGALATVNDEGTKLFDNLKTRGEDFEKEGKKQIESTFDKVTGQYKEQSQKVTDKVADSVEGTVKDVMERFDIPTRDEIHSLINKVDALTKKVDEMAKESAKKETKSASSSSTKTSATKK
eukprot:GDKH01014903.1.p1 GENE.GDKH01014903.1~~GDKH01014903.1.p1  ORF type:complete len:152 (-),score=34.59 GDKH01014903.1:174-629(-)